MNDKRKIENVSVLYDNQGKTFVKAYAMVDGKFKVIEGHNEVNDLLVSLKRQENVKGLNELPKGMVSTKFMYDKKEAKKGNYILSSDLDSWKAKHETKNRFQNGKLSRKSPYNGKKVSKINAARVTLATIATGIVLTGCAAWQNNRAEANVEAPVVQDISQEDNSVMEEEKKNPESWEEYLTYKDSTQKEFLVQKVMENNMKNAVKTLTIDGEDKTVGIPAEEMGSLLLYYGGNLYTDEELARIVGDYNLTVQTDSASGLVAEVNNGLFAMGLNVMYAKDINEVFVPTIGDEVADEANQRVFKALYEATHATNETRDAKEKELVQIMEEYHINGETKLNLQEHPAADIHLEVANEVFTLYRALSGRSLFTKGYSKEFFGTEAVEDVEQVGTITRTRGRNDAACVILDAKMESVMSYIHGMEKEEFEALTKDTYPLSYMYDLMDDYLVREMGLESVDVLKSAYDDIYRATMAKTGSTDPRGEFNPHTNPAGGKKGDTFTEIQKGVEVKESELTAEQKTAAQAQYEKETGVISADKFNEEKIRQELTLAYSDVYNATFNHFAGENVQPSSKSYNSAWESQYPGAWAEGKKDGLEYKANKAKEGTVDKVEDNNVDPGTITTDPSGTWDPNTAGDYQGSHDKNPNQQGNQNPGQGQTDESENRVEVPDPSGAINEQPAPPVEQPVEQPPVESNTQVNVYDQIDPGYTGDVTTDGTDVWDPSSVGEYDVQTYEAAYEVESYGTESIDLTEFYEETLEGSNDMELSKSL